MQRVASMSQQQLIMAAAGLSRISHRAENSSAAMRLIWRCAAPPLNQSYTFRAVAAACPELLLPLPPLPWAVIVRAASGRAECPCILFQVSLEGATADGAGFRGNSDPIVCSAPASALQNRGSLTACARPLACLLDDQQCCPRFAVVARLCKWFLAKYFWCVCPRGRKHLSRRSLARRSYWRLAHRQGVWHLG